VRVTTDSREIAAGDVFFAKRGEFDDGHRFAPMAAEQGAALLVVEHVLELAVPQIVVADTVDALGALATEVVARVRAAGDLRIVGVTGSNGKTTTKNLLRAVLERVGPTVAARASFNNEVGAPSRCSSSPPTRGSSSPRWARRRSARSRGSCGWPGPTSASC
jgi:UDP-N-acetylmuramoyl-tripeptide--D-alanyl-D-alanine ligase